MNGVIQQRPVFVYRKSLSLRNRITYSAILMASVMLASDTQPVFVAPAIECVRFTSDETPPRQKEPHAAPVRPLDRDIWLRDCVTT